MERQIKKNVLGKGIFRRLLRNKKAVFGAFMLLFITLCSIFAPYITPHDPLKQNLRNGLQPPSLKGDHLLGTDKFGRDMLARILYGGRISLRIGFISVGIGLVIGGFLGLIAGYYGGIFDGLIMRLMDIMLALPGLLLAMAIVSARGHSIENVMIAVGITMIPGFCRLMRAAVLEIRESDFVVAAAALGASDFRIIRKHILPNSVNPLIVHSSLSMASSILFAAGLSFLGMGAQPPTPEWGKMVSDNRAFIRHLHWVVTLPGLAIVLSVLSLNLVGDGLRDALDPRMKNK